MQRGCSAIVRVSGPDCFGVYRVRATRPPSDLILPAARGLQCPGRSPFGIRRGGCSLVASAAPVLQPCPPLPSDTAGQCALSGAHGSGLPGLGHGMTGGKQLANGPQRAHSASLEQGCPESRVFFPVPFRVAPGPAVASHRPAVYHQPSAVTGAILPVNDRRPPVHYHPLCPNNCRPRPAADSGGAVDCRSGLHSCRCQCKSLRCFAFARGQS